MTDKIKKGRKAECDAVLFLKQKGWEVLETNFRMSHLEVDIIAKKENELCFIEVKYRKTAEFGSPQEFVIKKKKDAMKKVANHYIKMKKLYNMDVTIGIVSVLLDKIDFNRGFFEW